MRKTAPQALRCGSRELLERVEDVALVERKLHRKATRALAQRIVLSERRPLAGSELRELFLQAAGAGRHEK
jgi:hypothetical protein